MSDTSIFSNHLTLRDGIYYSQEQSVISYPEDQNELCMQFEESSFWFIHRNDCIAEMIKRFPPSGAFLDIGGGNGFVAKRIQDEGFETIVLEPGPVGASNSKKRGVEQVICSTFQDAHFPPQSIDAAGMFDVIEHIEDDDAMLREIHASLKENGRLYLSVPAFDWLWSQVDEDAGHFRRYTKTSMKDVLERAGFELEFSTYIFSVLPLPIFLFRSIPSKLGSKKQHTEIAETKKKEHTKKAGILDKIWRWELNELKKGSRIGFGGTLLIVARKNGEK
ncbi:MAG: class I SAM-dependent methyltransferase [Salibacteraceae bacterium]